MVSECQDEVVYYDTFESADDIIEDDSAEKELYRLRFSARQLEARRGRITTKRSYLKNKRVCILYTHTSLFSLLYGVLRLVNCMCILFNIYNA